MIKKALIGTAAALLVGGFVFGRDVFSYVRTAGASVRDAVKSEVPIEFQVERAREMVERLVPEIRDSMHVIAEQQVDIVGHQRAEVVAMAVDAERIRQCQRHLAASAVRNPAMLG